MIFRTLSHPIQQAAKKYPVISITGARQSGKTTLVKALFKNHDYVLLEDADTRRFAKEDPRGFLNQFKKGAIIDEAQRAPELFSYLQGIVDENKKPGQFILTGSQNFLLLEAITQSLAGRVALFHLLPFTLSELFERKGLSPKTLYFEKVLDVQKRDLFELMHTGFFPRIHTQNLKLQEWLSNYYQTYLERDVRTITNVGDIETFSRFIALCAGRSGQLLDLSSMGNDCGISHTTAKRWLSILEASFVLFLLRPYYENFNKRIIKSPKLYFLDTGLLCYLLKIRSAQDLRIHALRGAIFETFVISEFYKKFVHQGERPSLYFWRDSRGREIDLLMDTSLHFLPLEIKSSETFVPSFCDHLQYWSQLTHTLKKKTKNPTVLYAGRRSFCYKDIQIISWRKL